MLTCDGVGNITLTMTSVNLISTHKITTDEERFKTRRGDVPAVMPGANIRRLWFDPETVTEDTDNTGTAERPLFQPDASQNAAYYRIRPADLPDTHGTCQNQLKTKTDNPGTVLFAGNTESREKTDCMPAVRTIITKNWNKNGGNQ